MNPGMSNATKYNNVDHVVLGVPHLQPVMEVFLAQFRSLLGIASIWSEERPLHKLIESVCFISPYFQSFVLFIQAYNFKMFISSSPVALSSWDMDRLLRRRTIENIVNTAKTLNSLRRLLTNLQNIVVQDHIQSKVKDALFYLQEVRFKRTNTFFITADRRLIPMSNRTKTQRMHPSPKYKISSRHSVHQSWPYG